MILYRMHLAGCAEYPPIAILRIAVDDRTCHCRRRGKIWNSPDTCELVRKRQRLPFTIKPTHVHPPRPRAIFVAHASACLITGISFLSTVLAKILAEAGYLRVALKSLRHTRDIVHHC